MLSKIIAVREAYMEIEHYLDGEEPSSLMDLSDSDLTAIAALMMQLMDRGWDTAENIFDFLKERHCKYDREVIDLLIHHFEGPQRERSLWLGDGLGRYAPHAPLFGD